MEAVLRRVGAEAACCSFLGSVSDPYVRKSSASLLQSSKHIGKSSSGALGGGVSKSERPLTRRRNEQRETHIAFAPFCYRSTIQRMIFVRRIVFPLFSWVRCGPRRLVSPQDLNLSPSRMDIGGIDRTEQANGQPTHGRGWKDDDDRKHRRDVKAQVCRLLIADGASSPPDLCRLLVWSVARSLAQTCYLLLFRFHLSF